MTRISKAGLDLVRQFEGLSLKAYRCPAGILTLGYGHTGGVAAGDVVTEARADELLAHDMERFERAVDRLCPVTTQGQFDALCSFAFNLGESALEKSTLRSLHLAGDYAGAAAQFARWNKGGGRELPGLTKRRAAERKLYLS